MLPPPAIRGLFRTDQRARAAYAEGAGIYRILPEAVCVPADRDDLASLVHWAAAHGDVANLRRDGASTGAGPSARAVERFERDAAPSVRGAAELVASRFPRTRKNSSGYALDAYLASGDLLDLVVGAEGTLGFVTAVEWRLDLLPLYRAGLRVALPSLDVLSDAVAALLTYEPSALELLDRSFLELVGEPGSDAVLLVEFEGNTAEDVRRTV